MIVFAAGRTISRPGRAPAWDGRVSWFVAEIQPRIVKVVDQNRLEPGRDAALQLITDA